MKKRILSAFVLLCMLLTLLPVSALAAENDSSSEGADENPVVKEAEITDADSLKAAVESAAEGATIEIPAGTYDVGNWTITKAISLHGAGAEDTILKGVVAISGSIPATEEPEVQVDGEAGTTEVTVSGITFQPADDSSVNHGLYFGNYNTDTEMKNWSITVEDCAFEGWQFAICLQGNSETMIGNTLTVTNCTFDRVFCGASVCAAIGTLDTENSNIEACGPYFYAAQVYGDVDNHNYYYFELGGEPLNVTIDNDNGRPAEGFKGFDVVVLDANGTPKSYAGTISDAIDAANNGDTIYLPAGEYDIGALNNVTKAVNIRGEGADKTILTGTIIYKNLTNTDEAEKVITVDGITLNAPSGENANHQGLCWSTGVSGYTLNVTNCVFNNWEYAVGINSGATGNTLNVSGTSFNNTWCAVSTKTGNTISIESDVTTTEGAYAVQVFGTQDSGNFDGYYLTAANYAADAADGILDKPDVGGDTSATIVATPTNFESKIATAEAGSTIQLTAGTYIPSSEPLSISKRVNLIGAGAGQTVIAGPVQFEITEAQNGETLTVSGITFQASETSNVQGLQFCSDKPNDGLNLAIDVENCAFDGWTFGITMNSHANGFDMTVTDCDFSGSLYAVSYNYDDITEGQKAINSLTFGEGNTISDGGFAVQEFNNVAAGDDVVDNTYATIEEFEASNPTISGRVVYVTSDLAEAVSNAADGTTLIVAPGKYDGNITFGGKSLTIKAQYPAYVDGVREEDATKLSEFTGTFNTFYNYSFSENQTVVIDGFALSGDGLKIGNTNNNTVGNLEVRHCTMEFGKNLATEARENWNQYNYFVKVSNEAGDSYYASVIVEDNYISGTPDDLVTPIQLWDVDNAVVRSNVLELDEGFAGQAISISKLAESAEVDVSGNTITNAGGGIYVTTWQLGGETTENAKATFAGSIVVDDNTLTNVTSETMESVFIGYEDAAADNNPYGLLGGSISAVGNTNDGEPVEAEIVYGPAESEETHITATFMDSDTVVGTINGTPASAGSPITITMPAALTRDNYTFEGWSDGTTTHEAGVGVEISENTTFTAVWSYNGSSSGGSVTRYTITIEDADHGSVKSSVSRASRGSSITLTVTPDEGYELESITVTQSGGDTVSLNDRGDGKYTFTMPRANVTVEAVFAASGEQPSGLPFTDVDADDWFYDAVAYVYENGMMEGTSDTTFVPDMALSRAMVAQVLYNLEEQPEAAASAGFPDVAADAWYADAVNWAAESGVVTGYDTGAFGPEDAVTREQLAVMLYRYAQYKGYDVTASADLSAYSDAASVSAYAETAMSWAVGEELFQGVGASLLSPSTSASRAEVATILMRFTQTEA